MSKKHPGRDTDFAKWRSAMAKLDFQLSKEKEERKSKEKKN